MKELIRTFKVITNDSIGNEFIWEIYTIDGETPDNTLYFFKEGDSPSSDMQEQIADKIYEDDYSEIL